MHAERLRRSLLVRIVEKVGEVWTTRVRVVGLRERSASCVFLPSAVSEVHAWGRRFSARWLAWRVCGFCVEDAVASRFKPVCVPSLASVCGMPFPLPVLLRREQSLARFRPRFSACIHTVSERLSRARASLQRAADSVFFSVPRRRGLAEGRKEAGV